MNEDDRPMPREDDVRAAGEAGDVEAEAQTVVMERRADETLGSGVMPWMADMMRERTEVGAPGACRDRVAATYSPSESAREMAQYGRITGRTH
jgi:hypothetical protein